MHEHAHQFIEEQLRVADACPHLPRHSPLLHALIDALDGGSLMLQLASPLPVCIQQLDLLAHLRTLGGGHDYAQLAPVALVAHDERSW